MFNVTETSSNYQDLENKPILEIITEINQEDQSVPQAVQKALPQIEKLIEVIVNSIKIGGRLFYIGAGTSGRLGILDASELPPTFGIQQDLVVGVIAGGDVALRNAVENAEDSQNQAWEDLKKFNINQKDILVGIAASGTTPYVIGGLKKANESGVVTGCIVCNLETPVAKVAKFPVEVIVGPEYITGSTRMKSGTAQKLVLNMISTTAMIQLGRVKGNRMIDMQLSNEKLIVRGIRMIMDEVEVDREVAKTFLIKYGSVRKAIEALEINNLETT